MGGDAGDVGRHRHSAGWPGGGASPRLHELRASGPRRRSRIRCRRRELESRQVGAETKCSPNEEAGGAARSHDGCRSGAGREDCRVRLRRAPGDELAHAELDVADRLAPPSSAR
jgi:hypothetical protein